MNAFKKTYLVIRTCETLEQLQVAYNMLRNHTKLYGYNNYLYSTYESKLLKYSTAVGVVGRYPAKIQTEGIKRGSSPAGATKINY